MSPDSGADPTLGVPVPFAYLRYPQTLNLYSYVGDNPLSNIDPDGHDYRVCPTGGKCVILTNQQYEDAINGKGNDGISAPAFGQSGNITCGGSVCGTAQYLDQGAATPGDDFIGSIAGGMFVGKATDAIVGTVAGWFGRGASDVAEGGVADVAGNAANPLFSGSKQALKATIDDMDLPPAQKANVLRAASRAGNNASITVERLSDGSVRITTSVPGRAGGFANYSKVIGPDGVTQPGSVVQEAFDRSGASVHYDPKY